MNLIKKTKKAVIKLTILAVGVYVVGVSMSVLITMAIVNN